MYRSTRKYFLPVLFVVGFFASASHADAACLRSPSVSTPWYGGRIAWQGGVGQWGGNAGAGIGTQDSNGNKIANDPVAGWVAVDLGCFRDEVGNDITVLEGGANEGGTVYVGTAAATKPVPNSSGAPGGSGWKYVGELGVGTSVVNCHNQWRNIGLDNLAEYKYIYYYSNGDVFGCAGDPNNCKPGNPGPGGSESDICWFDAALPPADEASCNAFTAPTTVAAGARFSVSATMGNTGSATWLNSGTQPYRLSSELAMDNMTWGLNRVDMTAASVPPGQTATFNFTATAPLTTGTYTLAFGMVHEGVAHMPTVCQRQVTVTMPPLPPQTCPETAQPDFADVPPSHPNYKAVSCMRRYCITVGRTPTLFAPSSLTLREETAAFISAYHRYVTKDWVWHQQNPASFSDVPAGYTFFNAIETAHFDQDGTGPKSPFVNGYGDGTYRPAQSWLNGFCGIDAPCGVADAGTTRGVYLQKLYDYGMARNQLPLCAIPTVTITASPTSITSGSASTLTWSSANATSCTASASPANSSWTGAKTTSGTQSTGVLTATTIFSITCTGPGGTANGSATVTVTSVPTVTLTASPMSIPNGSSSTLTWSSTNATSCTASSGWSGSKAISGTQSTGALLRDTTYVLTCTGPGGSANASVTVSVSSDLSARLSAVPASGPAPLQTNLTTEVFGSGTGPIDYYLWWHCTNTSVSTLEAGNACGSLPWPVAAGTCVTNVNGMTCVDLTSTSKTQAHQYPEKGDYVPKVIVNRGTDVQAQSAVTVGPPALPPTLVLTAAQPSQAALNTKSSILVAFTKVALATGGPVTIPHNSPALLTWDSNNTDNCVTTAGSGAWPSNSRPVDGTWLSGNLVVDTTYTATCSGPGGSVTDSVLVKVGAAPPSVTLTASPASVPFDGKSVITWNSSNAVRCAATSGPWTGDKQLPSGSEDTDNLRANTTYQITCWNSEGTSTTDSVTIAVTGATLVVDLKADLGDGYVDSGSGIWPLSDVDLKAITSGTATGDISYKFWCDARVTNPTVSETVSPTSAPDIQEQLNLCDYENQGRYFAKLSVTRSGITAVDTVEILVARACGLVQ